MKKVNELVYMLENSESLSIFTFSIFRSEHRVRVGRGEDLSVSATRWLLGLEGAKWLPCRGPLDGGWPC
jgi:hypothetical protein